MADHALGEQAGERLAGGQVHIAAIPERAHEEAGIEQVQHRMLDAADILVDRHPVVVLLGVERLVFHVRRGEAGEVPGAFKEGVERIGFPRRGLAATGAVHVLPGGVPVERIAGMVEIDVLRQQHRQVRVGHGDYAAVAAMDHRHRAAPIALARHAPVAQAVDGRGLAVAVAFQPFGRRRLGVLDVHAVQEFGIVDRARPHIGFVADSVRRRVFVRRQHHGDHRQVVLAGEIQVALVVGGAAEDRAGAIFHQHEIGDVDREFLAFHQRMARLKAGIVA